MPFLDKEGLAHLWNQIIARLNGKVEREELDALESTLREEIDEAITGGTVDLSAYETKSDATAKLDEAKNYTDDTVSGLTASDVGAIATTAKGVASGIAELDANGKVPTSQLPSYVDDVIEGTLSGFPTVGEVGKIYVDTTTNKTYRWSGSAYTEISASLALGTTSSTAYRGDRGNTAYTHSQKTTGNPHNVTASDVGAYTKSEVDNYTLITTAEINTICSKR